MSRLLPTVRKYERYRGRSDMGNSVNANTAYSGSEFAIRDRLAALQCESFRTSSAPRSSATTEPQTFKLGKQGRGGQKRRCGQSYEVCIFSLATVWGISKVDVLYERLHYVPFAFVSKTPYRGVASESEGPFSPSWWLQSLLSELRLMQRSAIPSESLLRAIPKRGISAFIPVTSVS